MEPRWDAPELRVASDTRHRARYRLLQSWYRETVLGARPGTYTPPGRAERPSGSLLHPDDVRDRPGLNFLSTAIHEYAEARAAVVQEADGTLEVGRLRHNMLSSMPMCFNLFGAVRTTPEAQLEFVRRLFDPAAESVERIECEATKGDLDGATLDDRSAFDAVIVTREHDGSRQMIGIETKYTEPFSPTRYGASDRVNDAGKYIDIHERSGWFEPSTYETLTAASTNQLWRTCLLAAAAERSGSVASAQVVVVALRDDRGAKKAIAGVTAAMTDPLRCRMVGLEEVVENSRSIRPLAEWADRFDSRYLDVGSVL